MVYITGSTTLPHCCFGYRCINHKNTPMPDCPAVFYGTRLTFDEVVKFSNENDMKTPTAYADDEEWEDWAIYLSSSFSYKYGCLRICYVTRNWRQYDFHLCHRLSGRETFCDVRECLVDKQFNTQYARALDAFGKHFVPPKVYAA